MNEECAIVIDNGSYTIKAGVVGESSPRVIPSVVGIPREFGISLSQSPVKREMAFGHDVKPCLFNRRCPIYEGSVADWDLMEKLWDYTFTQIGVKPSGHPIILTEPPFTTWKDRERIGQLMFETFNVSSMCLSVPAVLSLYHSGRTTGIVLDSGYTVSRAVPIYEGYHIPLAITTTTIGGYHITSSFFKFLKKTENLVGPFPFSYDTATANDIKEKLAFISNCWNDHCDASYTRADGVSITIGKERYQIPEILFEGVGYSDRIDQIVLDAFWNCEKDIRKDMSTVVVAGGTSMLPGFSERLKIMLGMPSMNIVPPEEHSAWLGGSVLAALPTFSQMSISRQEYNEIGARICRNCL